MRRPSDLDGVTRTASGGAPDAAAPHLRLVSNNGAPRLDLRPADRSWSRRALDMLAAEAADTPPTPLIRIPCPELPGIRLLLKDESALPSGSLKHRLARALLVHGIASGRIGPECVIVEGSSGSTAISLAWFARRLGLRSLAVVPIHTATAKRAAIEAEGGTIMHVAEGADLEAAAARAAEEMGGYHANQFARAAEVADWQGEANIAAELAAQLDAIGQPAPRWIVTGAGTGGTATTIGRHLRLEPGFHATRLCVVDPEGSAYFRSFATGERDERGTSTRIVEGIGRGRIGAAFEPEVIDHMVSVSDEGSVSGARWLARRIGRRFGPSTGTNVIGALILAQAMRNRDETGTIVLLGCDAGDRYTDTIYDDRWCEAHDVAPAGWRALLTRIGDPAFPAAY